MTHSPPTPFQSSMPIEYAFWEIWDSNKPIKPYLPICRSTIIPYEGQMMLCNLFNHISHLSPVYYL